MSTEDSGASAPQERGPVGQFVENLLVGTVEAFARAGAKALESLTSDASKAVAIQKQKIDSVTTAVKEWRERSLGELIDIETVASDGDLPSELR